ncbi:MAG TPA: radical SAM protein [Firmicutes bacterium]|nr:radical SAM protein [Bacillota bacterium]
MLSSVLSDILSECRLCPRRCGADRNSGGMGFCRAGILPRVARAALHQWEEPCISGTRGSGTVFFSHCNMRCVFCQNHRISHGGFGKEVPTAELARAFLRLQAKGAHNINLVSPTPFILQIAEALSTARAEGLVIPVLYNTNAYELPEALRLLDGLVDVYLPDLKYASDELAIKYSAAPRYFEFATRAILEMLRQVGPPQFDEHGLVVRGLIVRHLVLPGQTGDSRRVLDWIRANLPVEVYVSVMSQYTPMFRASRYPELNRRLTREEYDDVLDYFVSIGLENGYMQEESSAQEDFVPDFDLTGL